MANPNILNLRDPKIEGENKPHLKFVLATEDEIMTDEKIRQMNIAANKGLDDYMRGPGRSDLFPKKDPQLVDQQATQESQRKRSEEFQKGLGKNKVLDDYARMRMFGKDTPHKVGQDSSGYETGTAHVVKMGQPPGIAGRKEDTSSGRSIVATSSLIAEARNKSLIASKRIEDLAPEEAEEEYINSINILRTLENTAQDVEELYKEGVSFGKPSLVKYFGIGLLTVAKDGIDIASYLGVFTIPLWWILGPFLYGVIIVLFWLFDIKQKKAQDYVKNLEKNMEVIQENMAHAIRVASRVPGLKKGIAKYGIAKISKFAGKNTTIKIAAAGAIDEIPVANVIPWFTVGLVLSYLDERTIYKNAAKNAAEARSQLLSQLEVEAEAV